MKHRLAVATALFIGALSQAAEAQSQVGGDAHEQGSSSTKAPETAAPAPAPDDAAASKDAPQPTRPTPPVGLRLDGGYSPRRLVSLPVTGADVGLGLGVQPSKSAAVWGATRLFLGGTENGLSVFSVRVGAEAEAVMLDRLRLGLGVHGFLVGVGRAARDQTLLSWGPAVSATARVDVIQADGFAIFARAAIDGSLDVYDGSLFWGPSLGGGVDFDIVGDRAALK